MRRIVKYKSCLVLLKNGIKNERKFLKLVEDIFERNYKFFYFVENSTASLTACKMIKCGKWSVKCYLVYSDILPERKEIFDAYLPASVRTLREKIEWALSGCDAILTDDHTLVDLANENFEAQELKILKKEIASNEEQINCTLLKDKQIFEYKI